MEFDKRGLPGYEATSDEVTPTHSMSKSFKIFYPYKFSFILSYKSRK